MSARKKIAAAILTRVLVGSAGRCCLCFGLHGDFSEKKGQVAHIDHDRANHNEQNLVFLCLEHHDAFDSSTSQSKRITQEEVVFYRDKLFEGVRAKLPAQASGKDRNAFAESEAVAVFLESARPHDRFNSGMLNGYETQRACHADLPRIEPFVDRQLTLSGYSLVCGEEALIDGHLVHLSGEDPLSLLPNSWAVVSTREVISMPPWLTGKLTPHRASTLRFGLFTDGPSTVDPGFRGSLFVTAQNRAAHSVAITPGLPLITLELFLLNLPTPGWSPMGNAVFDHES